MKPILSGSILVTMMLLCHVMAQAQFEISGEFRPRLEYRGGYGFLRDSSRTPYANILGRARIQFDYHQERFTTRFSLQQAFVYGQNSYSSDTISKNTINIYEAWFKYHITSSAGVKIGRMELTYDDLRILGNSNWSMWAATHDAVVVQWGKPGGSYRGDFGFAINNIAPAGAYLNSYNVRNNYKYMGYLYEQKKFMQDRFTVSFLAVVDAFQKSSITMTSMRYDTQLIYNGNDSLIGYLPVTTQVTTTEDFPNILYARATAGVMVLLNLKNWNFMLNGYLQGGHIRDGRKLGSAFYAAYISFRVIKPLTLMAGYEHLSGNNFSDTTLLKTKVTGFSVLYGSTHGGYSYMDMFSVLVKNNQSPGLNDLYGRATVSFAKTMTLELTYRWFSIPHGYLQVLNPGPGQLSYKAVKKSLGSEIDLMYVYKPFPNFEINAAYCFFLPTSTM
jgi:hypothetical protein